MSTAEVSAIFNVSIVNTMAATVVRIVTQFVINGIFPNLCWKI